MSYIQPGSLDETNYPLFAAIKQQFGFIPNFYRAQSTRPDLIESETQLVNALLINERALTRQQKEYVFLVCSAANLNTYCVTAHCEIIRMLGMQGPEPEQIALDHSATNLSMTIKALLTFAVKLNDQPTKVTQSDIETLRTFGYSDEQIMEAVLIVGLAKFANYVSFGLGTVPDFENPRVQFSNSASAAATTSPL
jgi:uncharacterized peroxidase-related enzyme